MFDEIDLQHFFEVEYQDRQKIKWAGFYLSEHTEEIGREGESKKITIENVMSPDKINEILVLAQLKSHYLSVQKEGDFNYYRGYLKGFDDSGITIGLKTIAYEDIRHIEIVELKKW